MTCRAINNNYYHNNDIDRIDKIEMIKEKRRAKKRRRVNNITNVTKYKIKWNEMK